MFTNDAFNRSKVAIKHVCTKCFPIKTEIQLCLYKNK